MASAPRPKFSSRIPHPPVAIEIGDRHHAIVTKAKKRLVKLGSIADIQGYIHDNNTGKDFPPRHFLKSVKLAETIRVIPKSAGVIRYGVKPDGNSSVVSPILFPRTFGERHVVVWNPEGVFGKEFYKVIPAKNVLAIAAQLNSTFAILQREILGLVNLGDGAIKFSADDVAMFLVLPDLNDSLIRKPFERLASRPLKPMADELRMDDRRELDAVIFDAMGLSSRESAELYSAVGELVASRISKSQSIGT